MFPSFYPPKKSDPTEQVAGSREYVYGDETSKGLARLAAPTFVCGTDPDHLEVIGHDLGATHKNPVCTGSLNFEEKPEPHIVDTISRNFFDFGYAGIDGVQWLNHAVKHEKRLKLSGTLSIDVHFMFLKILAERDVIFIPYFQKADSYGYYLWAERQNYRYGLTSPYDPAKRRVTLPRIYSSDSAAMVELKRDIGFVVQSARGDGKLSAAADVLELLAAMRGVKAVRRSAKGVLLSHQDLPRTICLNALIYAPDYDEERLCEKLKKQKRLSQDECETKFQKILGERIQRHWERFGHPKLRVTFNSYLNLQLNLNKYESIEYISPAGLAWGGAVGFDAKFGASLLRLGESCRGIGERVEQLGKIAGDCFQETEPISNGCSGTKDAIAALRRAIDGHPDCGDIVRRATRDADQTVAEPRTTSGCDGGFVRKARDFHGAIHRLGTDIAGYPSSTTEIMNLLECFLHRRSIPPAKAAWFSDLHRLKLQPNIWAWLRFSHPSGIQDLDDYLKANRLLLTNGERLETPAPLLDFDDQQ